VASYHTNVARYAAYYRLGWLVPVLWWLLRTLHGRAAVNLATSAATCAELRARGIERVRRWPRGVDLDLFAPAGRLFTDAERLPELVRRVWRDNASGCLSDQARRDAEKWSWPAATEVLVSCYDDVIASHRGTARIVTRAAAKSH
jgi:glycosyltransferase involved in cell wall biosynthesis